MKATKVLTISLAVVAGLAIAGIAAFAAPTAPVSLTATSTTPTSVTLGWASSSDATVAGYKIFRGAVQIATTSASSVGYTDTGLTPSTTYNYTVNTYDASSTPSSNAMVSATTLADTDTPTVPQNLQAVAFSPTQINLTWSTSTDVVGVAGYLIYRDWGLTNFATSTVTSYSDIGLAPGSNHTYRVAAFDAAGHVSGMSDVASATTPAADISAPSIPVIISATPISTRQINLSWSSSTDIVGVAGYRVYRDDAQIATTAALSLADTGLATSTTYKYNVSAYDASGNVSATSSSVYATTLATSTPDTTAPSTPINLSAFAISPSQINLYWSASTDNVGVAGYNIFRGSTQVATTAATFYPDTGLATSTTYSYYIQAYDSAGNISTSSATVSATTLSKGTRFVPTSTPGIRIIGNEDIGRLINLRSNAKIKVLVYGGSSFNVSDIVRSSVKFGGAPAVSSWKSWSNRDRFIDRIYEFRARDMVDLIGATSTRDKVTVHFTATTVQGVVIDLTTSVRVKNLKTWKQDREREREAARKAEQLREAKKKAAEQAKEAQKRQQEAVKKQQELLKEKQKQMNENIKQIKNETKSTIKNLKQELKDVKSSSKENQKGKNGKK